MGGTLLTTPSVLVWPPLCVRAQRLCQVKRLHLVKPPGRWYKKRLDHSALQPVLPSLSPAIRRLGALCLVCRQPVEQPASQTPIARAVNLFSSLRRWHSLEDTSLLAIAFFADEHSDFSCFASADDDADKRLFNSFVAFVLHRCLFLCQYRRIWFQYSVHHHVFGGCLLFTKHQLGLALLLKCYESPAISSINSPHPSSGTTSHG